MRHPVAQTMQNSNTAPSLSCRALKGDKNMLEPEKVNEDLKHQQKIYKFSPKPPRRVAGPTRHFLRRRKCSLRSHFLLQENVFTSESRRLAGEKTFSWRRKCERCIIRSMWNRIHLKLVKKNLIFVSLSFDEQSLIIFFLQENVFIGM